MRKNKLLLSVITALSVLLYSTANADLKDYTTLRDIDKGTFNEYRYYMVKEYFKLKEQFDLKGSIDRTLALSLLKNAKTGYNYLPDSLVNQNYYNDLAIAVKRGYDTPNSEVNYEEIVKKLNDYLEKVNIQKVQGAIEATPISGNAPLTVTFRGRVTDPTGTVVPTTNYVWRFDASGTKKVIGRGASINYTFREEGNFSVFLDVKSTHKNQAGYNDVIPFSTRSVVEVKEKVASVLLSVNGRSLGEADQIKFTPDEANYGLIFDATSSTPTGGARFIRTEWVFGNGVERRYDGAPRMERVVFSREGNYPALLRLTTNEGRTVERKFTVAIHKPIATIQANNEEGFIGDKFVFNATSSVNEKNLSFTWNIIDINNDKVLTSKEGNIMNYIFNEKGRYNIQLKVKDSAGNEDVDTKIIYVNSRPPIAEFAYSVPDKSKPNRILLDGSKSYDPDFSDDGKLKYIWTINGEIVDLDQVDSKGAIGYYTFDSIGDQSVVLEVVDPDQMNAVKQVKIPVTSILSVELYTFPRAIHRDGYVRFVGSSPNAKSFEWDFGDGEKTSGTSSKTEHIYKKSGNFTAKLIVKDADGNSNEVSKTVYVGDSDSPLAVIDVDFGANEAPEFKQDACNKGAYIVDRVKVVNFRGGESINVDGSTTGLTYSWKIGNKYISSTDATYKFDELGCFPIKLTVKNPKTGAISTADTWVKVSNLKPVLTSLDVQVQDEKKDPVVISVSALGAKDPDGVIQSYIWYYYTDSDIEPQDFRITTQATTTFVLPKVTGNYYFVVVMKDNNDERFSSEDASSNKYGVTLSGDNVNTPLIDFKVNKNSLYIGEEAVFSATVKNILGQDITAKSEYAWDFDGDGFYDKETNVGNITNKYQSSGTFYSKVRVKYKGMTNVRTIEINVANILSPEFNYISLGDMYLFFNTSKGKFDKVTWDLGDGNIVTDKNYFSYTYEDGKRVHDVNLKIAEGTKVKDTTKEVAVNMKNMLAAKNASGMTLFAYPDISDETMTLADSSQKAYIYISPVDGAKSYGVDFDIDADSDLNGGKDDDVDNKNDPTYEKAGLLEILLNDKKTQKVRIYATDGDGNILESKDITLSKDYVKEEEIDIKKIEFKGVTETEKAKIEKLKSYVTGLPQEHRLKAMKYVQKLQEEWFYINEKTKIILEFESFIDDLGIPNETEIINLLESFLIEGQEDQSLRNMSYNVIKNLIPQELAQYKEIIANLDQIKSNPDKLEDNKVLGKEILEMIKDTSLITNEDKVTIKTQLQVFIYGSVDKIPQEVKQEVKQEEASSNKVIGLFSWFANIIGILFGVIILGLLGFFIWYKVSNKNKALGLQDFIIEKTAQKGNQNDVLGDFSFEKPKVTPPESFVTRPETPKVEVASEAAVPSPLPEVAPVSAVEPEVVQEEKVPDWLKGSLDTATPEVETPTVDSIPEVYQTEPGVADEVETKIEEEKVPDWLKGSLDTATPEVERPTVDSIPQVPQIEAEVADEVETKIEEEKVPDWLKGALEESPASQAPSEKDVSQTQDEPLQQTEELPDWLKSTLDSEKLVPEDTPAEVVVEKPKKAKKKEAVEVPEVVEKKEEKKPKVPKTPKPAKQIVTETPVKDELWDNGMDIPDWLKSAPGEDDESKDTDFWTLGNTPSSDDTTKKE